MGNVFICYSRKDVDFTDQLVADLKAAGVSIWRDVDNIPSDLISNDVGWRTAIEKALDQCIAMIIVLSPDAVESGEVSAEWNRFLKSHRPIFPVIHRECDVPYRLDIFQARNLQKNYATEVKSLIRALLGVDANYEVEDINEQFENCDLLSKVTSSPAIKLFKYLLHYVHVHGNTPTLKHIYTDLNWQGMRVTRRRLRYLQEAGLLTINTSDQIFLSPLATFTLNRTGRQLLLFLYRQPPTANYAVSMRHIERHLIELGVSAKQTEKEIEHCLKYSLIRLYKTAEGINYSLTECGKQITQRLLR